MSTTIPYKIYSIKFPEMIAYLSFIGVIASLLITLITKNSSLVGTTLLTLDFILGPFVIWILGNNFFYNEDHKFVSYKEYFKIYEKELQTHIQTTNFIDYLKKFDDFLNSNTQLLLIYSLTGYGKSHLLREVSSVSNDTDKDLITLFVVPNSSHLDIDTYLDKELDKRAKYILIYDDVDLRSEDVNKLLSYIVNKNIKIILTFSTCELNEILENKNVSEYKKIKIDWNEKDLIHFLRDFTGHTTISDDKIIIDYLNPSLIITKVEAVNNSNFDFKKLDHLIDDIDQDIKSCLSRFNYTSEEKENLLINMACIVPFPDKNKEILEVLKNHTNFEVNEIKKVIENLIKSGILIIVNSSVRFNSDILVYLYLFNKINSFTHEKLESLTKDVESLPNSWYFFPKNIYKNLGNTSQIINIFLENVTTINLPLLEQYFSNIINKWIDEESDTFGTKRKEILKYLEFFCQIIPDRSLDLLNTYLDTKAPISSEFYLNYILNTDDLGPIILRLVSLQHIKEELIEIIIKMETKKMTGTYGNYRPRELIKYLVSPFEIFNIDSICISLDLLELFLDDWNIPKIKILSNALNEIFSVSEFKIKWGLHKFQSFPVELKETPEIIKIRAKGLNILKKMINHSSLEVKLEGIKVSGEIGGRNFKNESKLNNQLIIERKEILLEIGNLLNKTTDFKLLCMIENLFLNWWSLKTPGTENVEAYLINKVFPRDLLYITSKHLCSKGLVINDFDKFRDEAPDEERGKWFRSQQSDYFLKIYKPKSYEELVISLNKDFHTPIKIIEFFKQLNNNLSDEEVNLLYIFIESWFKINPKLFISIKENDLLWATVPERFKEAINLALSNLNETYVIEIAKEILSELPNVPPLKLNSFLISLGRTSIDKDISQAWLFKMISFGSSDLSIIIISNLPYIFKDDLDLIADLLYDAIKKESELNNKMIPVLWRILDIDPKKIKPETLNKLRKDLLNKLILVPVINYEVQYILNFVLDSFDMLFSFIESRFEYYADKTGNYYESLPFEGFDYIKNNIKSYEDYEKFTDRFLLLYKSKQEWKLYLKRLVSSINDPDNLYMCEYIQKQIKENNIENMIIMLNFLDFNEVNLSLFIEVGNIATTSGNYKELKHIMDEKTSFNSYSREAGKVPEDFKNIIKLLQKMADETKSGMFRNLITSLIDDRKDDIKDHEDLIDELKHF
jgi:hypothetical protein